MRYQDRDDELDDDWEHDGSLDGLGEDDDPTDDCPYCGAAIYDDTPRCPECGEYLSSSDRQRGAPWWIVLGVVVCLMMVTFWMFG